MPLVVLAQRVFTVSAAFDDVQVTDIQCQQDADDIVTLTVSLAIRERAI